MMRTFISHFTPSKYFYNFLIILVTHIFQSNKKPGKPLIVRAFPAFPGQSPTVPTISLFLTFILLGYTLYRHHYRLILLDPARNCHRKKRARNSSFREFLTPFFTKIGEKPRFYREFLFFVIRKVTSTIVIISATNTSRYSGRMKNPMEFPRIPKIGGINVVPMYALAI